MATIYKYTLTSDRTELEMPAGAKVLSVQQQYGEIQLWAMVDPEKAYEWRAFDVYGTGALLPDELGEYVGTVQVGGGEIVLHVFDATR